MMYENILLPVDLEHDENWPRALETVLPFCREVGTTLHLLTVLPDVGMSIVSQYFPEDFEQKSSNAGMERLKAFAQNELPADIKPRFIIGSGRPYEVILTIAKKISAELIVMGAHSPNLADYLLGPNAARVARHARCSVFIAR